MADGFLTPQLNYINPATNDNAAFDPHAAREHECSKLVYSVLEAHYPGHPWRVKIDWKGGIVGIQIKPFMGVKHWYVIYISTLKEYERGKRAIIRGGGDILERYMLPRNAFDRDHFLTALQAFPAHRKFHGFVPA